MAGPLDWRRGSRGEHCIPDGRRSLVFDAQGTKRELVLADAAEQFDAGDRRGRAIIVLEAEHGPGKAIISFGKTAIETEAAVVGNYATMEPEHRALTTELHHVPPLLPGHAVFIREGSTVVFDTTGHSREAAYAVDGDRRRSRFVVAAGLTP
jgi:hypothetical protein